MTKNYLNEKFLNKLNINFIVDEYGFISVGGSLDLECTGVTDLGQLQSVGGSLDLEGTGVTDLGQLQSVGGSLYLEGTGVTDLGQLQSVGMSLYLRGTGVTDLGQLQSVGGSLYLEDNAEFYINNHLLNIKVVDGFTMIIESVKQKDDFTIYKAKYFKGINLESMPKCFIAERNGFFAHGDSIQQSINDCNFKYLQNNSDVSSIVKNIKLKQTVSREEYRIITGACSAGVYLFCKDNNISDEVIELPLQEVLKLTSNSFGGDKFRELFL